MGIGVLALFIGAVLIGISAIGFGNVQPPKHEEKVRTYPFPEEF